MTVAVWQIETLTASLVCFKISKSDLSFLIKNWRCTKIVFSPDKIMVNFSIVDCWAWRSGGRSDTAGTTFPVFSVDAASDSSPSVKRYMPYTTMLWCKNIQTTNIFDSIDTFYSRILFTLFISCPFGFFNFCFPSWFNFHWRSIFRLCTVFTFLVLFVGIVCKCTNISK